MAKRKVIEEHIEITNFFKVKKRSSEPKPIQQTSKNTETVAKEEEKEGSTSEDEDTNNPEVTNNPGLIYVHYKKVVEKLS